MFTSVMFSGLIGAVVPVMILWAVSSPVRLGW